MGAALAPPVPPIALSTPAVFRALWVRPKILRRGEGSESRMVFPA